ncbi:nuclease HARBI1 [Sarotherodon galilaeus]
MSGQQDGIALSMVIGAQATHVPVRAWTARRKSINSLKSDTGQPVHNGLYDGRLCHFRAAFVLWVMRIVGVVVMESLVRHFGENRSFVDVSMLVTTCLRLHEVRHDARVGGGFYVARLTGVIRPGTVSDTDTCLLQGSGHYTSDHGHEHGVRQERYMMFPYRQTGFHGVFAFVRAVALLA